MSLAPFVRILGRGPSRSRNLTREEAAEAMGLILSGEAAPEAAGALLMLMRYRGETAEEIAGFVDALRARQASWRQIGAAFPQMVDWPSYAAGRTRGLPWFLCAAKLVAQSGRPVLVHGWNSHQAAVADVRSTLNAIGAAVVETPEEAKAALGDGGVAYLPLEALDKDALRALRLRDVLGLRSAINTALRVMNPAGAETTVQGVFHPSYRELQQDAGRILGQRHLAVLKGGGGEFERHPSKTIALFGLRDRESAEITAPPILSDTRRLADPNAAPTHLTSLWSGAHDDPFAEATVIGTAAAALYAAGATGDLPAAEALARTLWRDRKPARAA